MPRISLRILFLVSAFLVALPPQAESQGQPRPGFFQIGAFREPARADALSEQLRRDGFPVHVLRTEDFIRVLTGPYCDAEGTESARRALSQRGYPSLLRTDGLVESIPRRNCAGGADPGGTLSAGIGADRVPPSGAVTEAGVDLQGIGDRFPELFGGNDFKSSSLEELVPAGAPAMAPVPVFSPPFDILPRPTFRSRLVVAAPRLVRSRGTLSGKIKDTTGGVMPGVTVRLFHGDATEPVLETVTDGAGNFTFGNPTGEHRIAVSVPGFARHEETVRFVPGKDPLILTLSPSESKSSWSDPKTN